MLKEGELIGAIGIYRQEVRPVHRQADRAGDELRRAGGHRDREHAAAQRAAPAHRRSLRIAGAADRDQRGAEASSQARPASWSRCSRPCWRTRRASARPSSAMLLPLRGRKRSGTSRCINAPPRYARFARSAVRSCQRRRARARPCSTQTKAMVRHAPTDIQERSSGTADRRAWRRAHADHRADAQGRRADRRDHHLPPGGAAVHRQAGRAGDELRRAGGDRDREHAAAQRAAPAHRRSLRIAGAADRDHRGAEGHHPARPANCSRCSTAMLENAARICEARFGTICSRTTASCSSVAALTARPAAARSI